MTHFLKVAKNARGCDQHDVYIVYYFTIVFPKLIITFWGRKILRVLTYGNATLPSPENKIKNNFLLKA